jgi:hypothetical protein
MAIRVNVTGHSNDVGFGAIGQYVGPASADVPEGTTSPVGDRHVADIAVELAELTVGGAIEEPHMGGLTLGGEAI